MTPRPDDSKPTPRQTKGDRAEFIPAGPVSATGSNLVDPITGRHALDVLYEQSTKPPVDWSLKSNDPSIYLRHKPGQILRGGYQVETVFEDPPTGFYAEGRICLHRHFPPVLVIRGFGSWYPVDRVLEDTPDVFFARLERQFNSTETTGAIAWLKHYRDRHQPADVTGESLGGKIAQQIAAYYPDLIRSTVTFNPLGISPKLIANSSANNVFHYFTLGERYAFWANGGDFLPGKFYQISKRGQKSCRYKLAEALVRKAPFPKKRHIICYPSLFIVRIVLLAISQLILLKRHNGLILNARQPVVMQIDRSQLPSSSNSP